MSFPWIGPKTLTINVEALKDAAIGGSVAAATAHVAGADVLTSGVIGAGTGAKIYREGANHQQNEPESGEKSATVVAPDTSEAEVAAPTTQEDTADPAAENQAAPAPSADAVAGDTDPPAAAATTHGAASATDSSAGAETGASTGAANQAAVPEQVGTEQSPAPPSAAPAPPSAGGGHEVASDAGVAPEAPFSEPAVTDDPPPRTDPST
jgi:hypothetical protein